MYKGLLACVCLVLLQVPVANACDRDLANQYEQKARDAGENYEQKALHYRKAINECPKSPDAYAELSHALLQIKEVDEAESIIKRGVEIGPKYSKIRRIYGDVLRAQHDFSSASEQYEKALKYAKIPRHRFYALAHLGWAQHGLNNHTESTKSWAKALDINMNFEPFKNRQLYNMVAWNYAVCRTAEICDGGTAVKFHNMIPSKNQIWYELGTGAAAHARMGDFATAVRLQEKSIELIQSSTDIGDKEKWLNGARDRMKLYKQAKPYTEN